MRPRFEVLYNAIEKRINYWRWNRLAKYSMAKGYKVPGTLFIAVRLGHGISVVEANNKDNAYSVDGVVVSFETACKLVEHANKEIRRYKERCRKEKKVNEKVRKPVVLNDVEFHRQKDLESRYSSVQQNITNAPRGKEF